MPDDGLLARIEALAVAIASLVGAGMNVQAKALADELSAMARSARGCRADVISLAVARLERDRHGG